MKTATNKGFKNIWLKAGLLSLSFVFMSHADGSTNDIKPFSEMWGNDLTIEQSSHKYTPAIFIDDYIAKNLKLILERSSEEERSQYVFEITYKFMDNVRKYISQEEKEKGHRLSYKELAFTVDKYVNDYVTYEKDEVLYKELEYYATPFQTILNKKGDCEDFAILKYHILKKLYFPEERMRLAHSPEHMNLIINVKEGIYQLDNDKQSTRIPISSYRAVQKITGLISLDHTGRNFIENNFVENNVSITRIHKIPLAKPKVKQTAQQYQVAETNTSHTASFNSLTIMPKLLVSLTHLYMQHLFGKSPSFQNNSNIQSPATRIKR